MREEDSRAPDDPGTPCGHRNPANAHFCDVCGVKLPVHCPRCHAINRPQANFCGNCGSSLRDAGEEACARCSRGGGNQARRYFFAAAFLRGAAFFLGSALPLSHLIPKNATRMS